MDKKELLLQAMQEWCDAIGVNYGAVSKEVVGFIGSEAVLDYCFTKGSTPDFPNTLGDVFILSETSLYDYERQKQGSLLHWTPLRMISGISESFGQSEKQTEAELFLQVMFRYGGLASIIMCDRLMGRDQLRRFADSVKSEMLHIK